MTTSEFRKQVRTTYPHVKVAVRTVSFMDLARDSAKCLTITGDRNVGEQRQVNEWAKQAGILPDSSIHCH